MDAHRRPKEAHVVAAMEAACCAHGLSREGEPAVIEVVETDERGRARLVRKDNSAEHRSHVHERRALEAAFVEGSLKKHPAPRTACTSAKEAHVIEGDSLAIGHRIKAQLEARKARLVAEREARVAALAQELAKDPASALKLARMSDAEELSEALRRLGVST